MDVFLKQPHVRRVPQGVLKGQHPVEGESIRAGGQLDRHVHLGLPFDAHGIGEAPGGHLDGFFDALGLPVQFKGGVGDGEDHLIPFVLGLEISAQGVVTAPVVDPALVDEIGFSRHEHAVKVIQLGAAAGHVADQQRQGEHGEVLDRAVFTLHHGLGDHPAGEVQRVERGLVLIHRRHADAHLVRGVARFGRGHASFLLVEAVHPLVAHHQRIENVVAGGIAPDRRGGFGGLDGRGLP